MTPEPSIQSLGIDRLAVTEKFRLIDEIWLSIAQEKGETQVPTWHRQLLDERLAEFDADPEQGDPWEEVEVRLRGEP